jgi:hypothetical protein
LCEELKRQDFGNTTVVYLTTSKVVFLKPGLLHFRE